MQMLPDVIVIGAPKAGTTALFQALGRHPEIFMSPIKEPHFFAFEGETVDFQGPGDDGSLNSYAVTSLDAYQKLFANRQPHHKIAGEASALYLYYPNAPKRIQAYVPDVKLIAILRDPVDRAYSSYLHMVRDGREPLADFETAVAQERKRIQQHWTPLWYYRQVGLYGQQIERYMRFFSPEQMRIYLYEDLQNDPLGVIEDIYGFLGVDTSFQPPEMSKRYNATGIPKRNLFHMFYVRFLLKNNIIKAAVKLLLPRRMRQQLFIRLATAAQKRFLTEKPTLPSEVRARLVEGFRQDVLHLEKLIERDLSGWLSLGQDGQV